ncbi:MAG: flagellar hook-length control protein FliK [Pseudomonadota bacterium]|nr:flagellar hook-length control protein FliK [Pseudomonadota bacterium]
MSLLSTNGAAQSVPDFSSSVKQNAYQSDNSSYGVQSFDEVYSNAHSKNSQRQNSNDDAPPAKPPSKNTQKNSSQATQSPSKTNESKKADENEDASDEAVASDKATSASETDDKEAVAAEDAVSKEASATEEALLAEALKSQKTDEETAEAIDESEEILTLNTESDSTQVTDEEDLEVTDTSLLDQAEAASQVVDASSETDDDIESDDESDTTEIIDESVGDEILTTAVTAQDVVQETAKTATAQDTSSLEVDDSLQPSSGLKAEVATAATEAQTENTETADLSLDVSADQTIENVDTDLQNFKLPEHQNQTTKTGQSTLPTLENVNDKPVQMSIAKPVSEPDWGDKVMDRVRWMANATQQKAEIRLDPPDLGPLKVEVSIKNEHAQVTMTSHSSQVREILDQHLPRLREALESQGFQSVDAQTKDGQQQQNSEQKSGGHQRLGELATGEDEMVESTIIVGNSSKGRVDCYI